MFSGELGLLTRNTKETIGKKRLERIIIIAKLMIFVLPLGFVFYTLLDYQYDFKGMYEAHALKSKDNSILCKQLVSEIIEDSIRFHKYSNDQFDSGKYSSVVSDTTWMYQGWSALDCSRYYSISITDLTFNPEKYKSELLN